MLRCQIHNKKKYLADLSLHFEHIWWSFIQKRVVPTKLVWNNVHQIRPNYEDRKASNMIKKSLCQDHKIKIIKIVMRIRLLKGSYFWLTTHLPSSCLIIYISQLTFQFLKGLFRTCQHEYRHSTYINQYLITVSNKQQPPKLLTLACSCLFS